MVYKKVELNKDEVKDINSKLKSKYKNIKENFNDDNGDAYKVLTQTLIAVIAMLSSIMIMKVLKK